MRFFNKMKKTELVMMASLFYAGVAFAETQTVYSWESPEGTPAETSGTMVYINGEGGIIYTQTNDSYTVTSYTAELPANVVIPAELNGLPVTAIGVNAFANATTLHSIIIPEHVVSIGDSAFSKCENLTTITIPESVTSIGEYAFYNCSKITNLYVNSLEWWSNTNFSASYSRPNSWTTLLNLYIDNELLTEVEIPSTMTKIPGQLFRGCSTLRSVKINEGVTEIGVGSFAACNNLTTITIPSSVTRIRSYAFDYCTNLASVKCKAITPPSYKTSLSTSEDIDPSVPVFVPVSSVQAYKEAIGWRDFTYITGYLDMGECGEKLTWLLTEEGELIIEGTGDMSDDSPWKDYKNDIKKIRISEGVTSIGQGAFSSCSALNEIVIPSTIRTIGREAFMDCKLTKVRCLPEVPPTIDGGNSGNTFGLDESAVLVVENPSSYLNSDWAFWFSTIKASVSTPDDIAIHQGLPPFGQDVRRPWKAKYLQALIGSEEPDENWYMPDFDDSHWGTIHGPISNHNENDYYAASQWQDEHSTYWVRRYFTLDSIPTNHPYVFKISYDDDCKVYLNGQSIYESNGAWNTEWEMSAEHVSYLKKGINVLAVMVSNSGGSGANMDFGISRIVPVKSMSLSYAELSIEAGEVRVLTAHTNPDAINPSVTWSVADPEIAEITDFGRVYAKKVGTTTVTATSISNPEISATCQVTVTPQKDYTYSTCIVPWGRDEAWTAKYQFFELANYIEPADDVQGNTWKELGYDDSAWETLTGPIGSDPYSMYNYEWLGDYNCFCLRRSFTLPEVGEYHYWLKLMHDDEIKVYLNGKLVVSGDKWTDAFVKTFEIPRDAFVPGDNMLAIYIQDNEGGNYLDYMLYYDSPVTELTISPSNVTLKMNESVQLTTTTNANASNQTVRWHVDNPLIAAVSSSGKIRGIKTGTTTVTATSASNPEISATCTVTVTDEYAPLTEGWILPTGSEIPWEMTYQHYELADAHEPGHDANGKNWTETGYDDTAWNSLIGPMGNEGIGHPHNYIWEGDDNCFYLRRTFMLPELESGIYHFHAIHDDGVRIYLNGHEITEHDYNMDWHSFTIPANLFVTGENTLAIYAQENGGESYLDYGLYFELSDTYDITLLPCENGTITGGGNYEAGSEVTLTATPNEGYHFVSWSDGSSENPYRFTSTESKELTAIFAPNTYTVTYLLDGETFRTESVVYGNAVPVPEAPFKEGYTFGGWDKLPETMPAQDLTCTAIYLLNEEQTDAQGLVYRLNDTQDAFIFAGYTDGAISHVTISETLYGLPVTSIQAGALADASNLKSVTLPSSITHVGQGAFSGCYNLMVVEWNAAAPLLATCFDAAEAYGNMLVFTSNTDVNFAGNVVINGQAEKITLSDGRPFRNPKEFTAKHISYNREFTKKTKAGMAGGWEGIVLPFDVQTISHEEKGLLSPFGVETEGLPCWIAEWQPSNKTFVLSHSNLPNQPFIMEVPNSEEYDDRYNIEGQVTFAAENVTVHATTDMTPITGNGYSLQGTYEGVTATDNVYALNDDAYTTGSEYFLPGGVFVAHARDIRPFEAYIHNSQLTRSRYLPVQGGKAQGMDNLLLKGRADEKDDAWYTLQGIRLNGKPMQKGMYIHGGKRVIVR